MASKTQVVQSKGIYHGLPTFDASTKDLTAIVTGANGISGSYMVQVLAESPQRWKNIYCLSRRPPAVLERLPSHAEHIPCDFLKSPQEIAESLKAKGVKADYVFFFAYIQPAPKPGTGIWSAAEEMTRINTLLLDNFLKALPLASIKPSRIMLQTGAKNYGIQHGPAKVPMKETQPRITHMESNFYYAQEDALSAWCRAQPAPSPTYTIAMPSYILGAVPDAAMNAAYPLAIYAAVCAHLGEPLAFPAGVAAWQNPQEVSSARMNAYLEEWAVLQPDTAAAGQKFNACDGSAFAWEGTWPVVAGWYGLPWKGPEEEGDGEGWGEVKTPFDPPPRGYGGPGKMTFKFTTAQWAKDPKVAAAWRELAQQHGLHPAEFADVDIDRVFGFLDAFLLMSYPVQYSMDKARKLGWHGFVDTDESLLEVIECLAKLKMVPPVPRPGRAMLA